MDLRKSLNGIYKRMSKRSPEILIGFGIAGMALAIPFAVIGTIKACESVENEKKKKQKNELTKKEIVKATWKCYIPTAISFTSGAACVIGSSSIHNRRNAALATAYSISENALRTYQDKVVEAIGEKKEKSIRDSVSKDIVEKNPVTNKEVIITGKGETLCFDPISGRYFKCGIDKIQKVECQLNQELYGSMYVALSEFYYEIGLKPTSISDDIGWNAEDGPISFDYSSQLADDGTPCLVIEYLVAPRYDYRNLK